jgi:hypothetical protein
VTFWAIFHCLWAIFSQKHLVTLSVLKEKRLIILRPGDQVRLDDDGGALFESFSRQNFEAFVLELSLLRNPRKML